MLEGYKSDASFFKTTLYYVRLSVFSRRTNSIIARRVVRCVNRIGGDTIRGELGRRSDSGLFENARTLSRSFSCKFR